MQPVDGGLRHHHNNDINVADHHHHGDDQSTLIHNHNGPADHVHHVKLYHYNDKLYIYVHNVVDYNAANHVHDDAG